MAPSPHIPGFASEVFDSQAVFRQLLHAMATPGRIMDLDIPLDVPAPLDPAAGALLLCLMDNDTPLWSDLKNASQSIQWLRLHTGAPYTRAPENAAFALYAEERPQDPSLFNPGTPESPHLSTTLVAQAGGVNKKGRIRLTGPGIETETFLKLDGVAESFLERRAAMARDYPLGVDMIFVCNRSFVALPRTTTMEFF